MKKTLLSICIVYFTFCLFTNAAEKDTAIIKRTLTTVVIDGGIDNIWAHTDSMTNELVIIEPAAGLSAENFTGYWKGLWDENYFYILAYIKDDILINDNDEKIDAWDDGFDIPIEPGNLDAASSSESFLIGVEWSLDGIPPVNPEKGGSFPEGIFGADASDILTGCSDLEDLSGWILEMAIPWEGITSEIVAEDYEFGFDMRYNDDDGNVEDAGTAGATAREGHYNWATQGGWDTPADWGTIILGAETVEEVVSSLVTKTNTIEIFPNPAYEIIKLKNLEIGLSVRLINLTGQEMYSSIVTKEVIEIDVANLSSGIYILNIGKSSQKVILM